MIWGMEGSGGMEAGTVSNLNRPSLSAAACSYDTGRLKR